MNPMKNKILALTGMVISSVIISACDPTFDNPVGDSASYNNGDADFSNFVSIGDSLTAGYADGALYLSGQQNSYPAILAQQFAKVGGGNFTQPLVSDNLGGLLIAGVANIDTDGDGRPDLGNRLVLNAEPKNPPDDLTPKGPEPITGTATTEATSVLLTGTFNNMGVPGAKSFHLGSSSYGDPSGLGAGTANPYFVRFASATDTSVIADAAAQQPSFFVLWIGNNDVLSYATSGGIGTDQLGNSDPSTYGSKDITNPATFADIYAQLIGVLTAANSDAKGILVNIPDVASIPYFKTVPYNAIPLDQTTADALNTAYAAYNAGLAQAVTDEHITQEEHAKRTITFAAGLTNPVVILDEDLTDLTGISPAALLSMRQATAEDLLVLGASSRIGELVDPEDDPLDSTSPRWGISAPLEDGDVLIPSEIKAIEDARTSFNATIKATADANDNLLLLDVAAIMAELSATGVNYGTGFINATYATGGGFSLDGVHPTARGYAVIANRMIDTINTGFNANIPVVNPGAYTTIFLK